MEVRSSELYARTKNINVLSSSNILNAKFCGTLYATEAAICLYQTFWKKQDNSATFELLCIKI